MTDTRGRPSRGWWHRCLLMVAGIATALLLVAGPAHARTTETPSSASTSTTMSSSAVTKEGSPQNNVGLVVGGVAVGAIVIGALVLYLRYRPRPPQT